MEAAAAATHRMGCLPGILPVAHLGLQQIPGTPSSTGMRDFPRVCMVVRQLARAGASCRKASRASATAVHFTDKFDATQQEQWQSSRELVEELGFSAEDATDVLAQSFGWSYSDFWGEEKEATVPDPESVSASLSLMKSLGVDMAALVKKFPEVMGLSEGEIQYSLGTLDGTWGIAGKNLKNVLMRNPQVLGFNFDCGGDCAGQCSRCWVRF